MKFWRVEAGFVHVKDCLTRKKADTVAATCGFRNPRITPLEIETHYPHFDAEDLATIRDNPIYFENVGHLLPQLISGRARE